MKGKKIVKKYKESEYGFILDVLYEASKQKRSSPKDKNPESAECALEVVACILGEPMTRKVAQLEGSDMFNRVTKREGVGSGRLIFFEGIVGNLLSMGRVCLLVFVPVEGELQYHLRVWEYPSKYGGQVVECLRRLIENDRDGLLQYHGLVRLFDFEKAERMLAVLKSCDDNVAKALEMHKL